MPKRGGRKPKKRRPPASAPKKRLDHFNTTPKELALSTQPAAVSNGATSRAVHTKNKTDREAYNGCCPCGHRDSPVCLCVYIDETMRGHAAASAPSSGICCGDWYPPTAEASKSRRNWPHCRLSARVMPCAPPKDGQGHTGWGFYPKISHARASALSTTASYSRCVKSLWARRRVRARRNFLRRLKKSSPSAVRTSTNASSNSPYSLA